MNGISGLERNIFILAFVIIGMNLFPAVYRTVLDLFKKFLDFCIRNNLSAHI